MLKLTIEIQDKDSHKLITHLEMIQWAIAGGENSGTGWKVEGEDEGQRDSEKT